MKANLSYLWYVLRHKWYVLVECCKLGIPWLGVTHDLSRFGPSEWFAYSASAPYNKENKPPRIARCFDYAWNRHQHRNKHHWEYWVHYDYHNHNLRLLKIPDKYRREMLADWRGASRAKTGKDNTIAWYKEHSSKIQLYPETRGWIEKRLD